MAERAHRRRTWTEAELARIAAAWRGGLSTYEIAMRFGCNAVTIQKRLAELRAREERLSAFAVLRLSEARSIPLPLWRESQTA